MMNALDSVSASRNRAHATLMNRIGVLLQTRWLFYLGAAALTSVFWWSGLTKMWNFTEAQAEMAHFGLKPPGVFALMTIVLQLGGSALVIVGKRWAWLGAGALALFTLATIPLAHDFWHMEGPMAFLEKTMVQEHVSVIGGLILAAILGQLRKD
jgi:uncharacterized membrane protein YphA (DoxX/SURF4 family)